MPRQPRAAALPVDPDDPADPADPETSPETPAKHLARSARLHALPQPDRDATRVVDDPANTEETPPARAVASEPQRYSVTLVLSNDGAGGDSAYEVMLTESQIMRLLSDNETPRFIRLHPRQNGLTPYRETRFVRVANISEVHIANLDIAEGVEWR